MREKVYNGNNVDRANRVSYDWSLLAPVQYQTDEHGIIDGEVWEDKSGEYSPSITTRFYELTFTSMAENLTLDLISRYVYRDDTEVKALNNSELDNVYIAEEGITKQIFAYLDNQVIHITYHGKAKIEDIIPLVSEMLFRNQSCSKVGKDVQRMKDRTALVVGATGLNNPYCNHLTKLILEYNI